MTLHEFLDFNYGHDGNAVLRQRLDEGGDANEPAGPFSETPLHVAIRRRRKTAASILLDYGADINAKTVGGKTAYAHAVRRGFTDLVGLLARRGASTELNNADQFAVAIVNRRLGEARRILAEPSRRCANR